MTIKCMSLAVFGGAAKTPVTASADTDNRKQTESGQQK